MSASADKSLRIAIATSGRFHVLDLARELDGLGHEVHFYSYVPRRRARKFGLPARCHVALLPWMAPCLALVVLLRRMVSTNAANMLFYRCIDRLVAWRLRPCDVFIGMSGIYLRSFEAARMRYGARLVVERGSVHIEAQKEILDAVNELNPAMQSVDHAAVARDSQAYALADRIAVPSLHAKASFTERGFAEEKVFCNPYGVNLRMFTPGVRTLRDPKLILFVGGWSFQKGVDVLVEAMRTLGERGFHLCHLGAVADAPLPNVPWFHSEGHVDQSALADWYRRAGCLVLPSRQEGLSLVQIQALACGCPVIGTTMSGARDLKRMLDGTPMVKVLNVGDSGAIVDAVTTMSVAGLSVNLDAAHRADLSWGAYARRYEAMLVDLVSAQVALCNGVHRIEQPRQRMIT